jgi:hypothetical protein
MLLAASIGRVAVVTVCAFAAAAPARADTPFHIPVYTGTPLMISAGVVTQQTLNRSIASGSRGTVARASSTRSPVSTRVDPEARSRVPALLAAELPAAGRDEAERAYRQMLEHHPELMRRLGVPADDVAAALATFVAGIHVAYHDVDFPDRRFGPLYRQMRDIIAAEPEFARASSAERRDLHARLAILGTFLALTREALKRQPDAQASSRLKSAAADYLRQFMKADAGGMRITDDGLRLD